MSYDIESYWSRVAGEIRKRGAGNYVAGDDDPYYRYKRAKFLRLFLAALDVAGRHVLELGCGPGGNLRELVRRRPASLVGIDISASMLDLARQTLEGRSVDPYTAPPSFAVDVQHSVITPQAVERFKFLSLAPSRLLFYRLLEGAVVTNPVTYHNIARISAEHKIFGRWS